MATDTTIPLSLRPMEAEPVDDLPKGNWLYEPKYDGFRCLAYRSGDKVDLQSKKQKSLNRFFPEVASGLVGLKAEHFVLDSELIIPASPSKHCSFDCTLQQAGLPNCRASFQRGLWCRASMAPIA
jgi:ATP-dependent DNA ligase